MKTIVYTDQSPAPIGPYSQAVKTEQLVYTSGQIPIDPQTDEMVENDIQVQTRQVIHNLEQVLLAAGASLGSVVKTTVFLSNMADFPAMNAIYADAFGDEASPARSTVEVAALPKGALVEIEAIAVCANE